MAVQPSSGQLWVLGGFSKPLKATALWRWDGQSWASFAELPTARSGHALAFDPAELLLVLGGGNREPLSDAVLVHTPEGFRPLPAPPELKRTSAAAVLDPVRRRLVLFGGIRLKPAVVHGPGELLGDTWELDGDAWQFVKNDGEGPGGRYGAAMAYDAAGKRVLLFGGARGAEVGTFRSQEFFADLWAWDGESWTQLDP